MNAAPHQPADASRRARALRALGVTPWVRRAANPPAGVAQPEPAPDMLAGAGAGVDCVVILPAGCGTRELDLLGRALSAGGASLARAARIAVSDGQLAANVPEARAYLVFGEAQAHALGRDLPAAALHRAQIVLADEPALVLTRADAKRRLWNALRGLRRALATAGG
ncbi:MAG: hypothetical protein KGJ97_04840 [Xanthomonadaceae bacterium]|nr:hypothetical protein [Xanthomonadaceae bacterium]